MKKSKAEIIADLKAFIGENNSDDAIALVENVSDSIEDNKDYDELKGQYDKLKEDYDKNDKAWRQRYIDRFNNEEKEDDKEVIDVDNSNDDKPLTYENLFEEE